MPSMSGFVHASVHTYWLLPETAFLHAEPDFPPAWPVRTGLVVIAGSGVGVVTCGTEMGDVAVSIVRPEEQDLDEWTEVVEHSVRLPSPRFVSTTQVEPPEIGPLAGRGFWRVRACARRRDEAAAAGMLVPVPIEEHQLSAWPVGQLMKAAVIKGSDAWGASAGREL